MCLYLTSSNENNIVCPIHMCKYSIFIKYSTDVNVQHVSVLGQWEMTIQKHSPMEIVCMTIDIIVMTEEPGNLCPLYSVKYY